MTQTLIEPDADGDFIAEPATLTVHLAPPGLNVLSERERQVFQLLATTILEQPEIARELYISVNTIKSHAKKIYEKLGVTRRAELRRFL